MHKNLRSFCDILTNMKLFIFDMGDVILLEIRTLMQIAKYVDTDYHDIRKDYGYYDRALMDGYMDAEDYYRHLEDKYHCKIKEDLFVEFFKPHINEYMLGVVDDGGEWVQELTDTGTFVEEVRFRAEGSSETLRDSSCYMYLGEGVFLASPGVSVYTKDEEYRVGPWPDMITDSATGQLEVAVWECLIWNVVDNSQAEFDASKISTFQDGYSLFCEAEDAFGGGRLNALNTKGEITEFTCEFVPNKPGHNFPVYSEGLFYACTDKAARPGFYDIEGNMVIDLSSYNMGRIPYSSEMGVNAPYFENGQATILFANNAGSVFEAVIDKTGAFVGEPEKVDVSVY